MKRKCDLVTGEIYHVFTRSIAGYTVFNRPEDFERLLQAVRYYQVATPPRKFSDTLRMVKTEKLGTAEAIFKITADKQCLVQIIAFCIMPTHLHLVLKQVREGGIATFMRRTLNSYAKYFNVLHQRKGPLWEGRFQNVRVETDEQLVHLTRYVHLNPVTAGLTDKPEKWPASSYPEYLGEVSAGECLCDFRKLMDVKPGIYRLFVEDRIAYQRDLAKIKAMFLD